jgi:small subunit ribosomal protein S17
MRQNFVGMVVSNAMEKTVKVKVIRQKLHPIVLKVKEKNTC